MTDRDVSHEARKAVFTEYVRSLELDLWAVDDARHERIARREVRLASAPAIPQ